MTEWQAAILLAQMERLPAQIAQREANLRFLDAQLNQIDGLKPLIRRPQVTRQGMYAYVFRYNAEAFHNIPVHVFRQALAAELGTHIGSVYEPLNYSPLYQPHTKRRYRLNEEHWRAIDPTRFDTPVAAHAYANESVVISQPHLLAERAAIQAIADACVKLQANPAELIARAGDVQPVRN
jgi:L-glutamine:2-deoxy-scyllo-inosose/3-amino-2,3-dideoxy-scyllo-inosose aminotransferase